MLPLWKPGTLAGLKDKYPDLQQGGFRAAVLASLNDPACPHSGLCQDCGCPCTTERDGDFPDCRCHVGCRCEFDHLHSLTAFTGFSLLRYPFRFVPPEADDEYRSDVRLFKVYLIEDGSRVIPPHVIRGYLGLWWELESTEHLDLQLILVDAELTEFPVDVAYAAFRAETRKETQ